MPTQLKKFEADWGKAGNISPYLRSFIEGKMKFIYSKGIISNDDYNNL